MSTEPFAWPWQYDFPPFFTLQPNAETRRKQMDTWCQLVLAYCQNKKQTSIDITSITDPKCELFHNAKIGRKANPLMVTAILDELHNRGNLEWLDKTHKTANIIWRKPSGWAKELENWVKATGRNNTVCTIYEIIDGEETEGETFHGIDRDVIMEALRYMEKHGKAEIMGDAEGVKFFCA
ncbi:unnamed protein product [Schistocephalus solidus]|uniref:Vacuolar protein-sorting-associated protein 25 n=1 Tax=Schistocephalus solidus TaxID=70667 RepID=A0A0X3PAM0_SCHSO|nr:unnamed protein product [Schistocephalus solidus]